MMTSQELGIDMVWLPTCCITLHLQYSSYLPLLSDSVICSLIKSIVTYVRTFKIETLFEYDSAFAIRRNGKLPSNDR